MNKVVLITGTSSGLGFEAALQFAEQNYTVYASMRNLNKKDRLLEESAKRNTQLKIIELDVCQVASINQAVQTIQQQEGRIDILINNAGAGFAKTTEQASEEEIQWVTEVNYLSVVRCTKAVLPWMRKQKSGHIINISSVGGLVGQPFNELYCAAKFAVEGYTEALATYLPQNFGIHFTAIEPGGIATEFSQSATKKTMGTNGIPQDDYLPILQKYIAGIQERAAQGDTQSFQQAHEVAQVILGIAQSSAPPIRVRTSKWAEEFCQYKTNLDPKGKLQNSSVVQALLNEQV
ncbi:SDR family oxidoreductase [Sunxiuqinia elliptica]|uniref:Short-chain dehydrogenase n=1 Tax=Sunxiuqinia elliptica TaxID=655355 RepID=A0A1I2IRB1_9BACT|nr:SDR family oxidoreductase [Sunxiuqinia elliptica]SFF43597.1 Short-chain dehydrogenase [Sunxiuqinia elliptica]